MSAENPRPSEHEELLRAAALGQLDLSTAEIQAKLRANPELERAVRELLRTRETTSRVMREGSAMIDRARAEATPQDQARVREILQDLARGGRREAGRRRGWIFLVAGLAAAAVLGVLLLRKVQTTVTETWLGSEGGGIEYVPAPHGPGALRWKVALLPGDTLELSFYALRDGAPQELVLGPLGVGTDGWQPTGNAARALPSDWIAELWRRDTSGERELLGRVQYSSPH